MSVPRTSVFEASIRYLFGAAALSLVCACLVFPLVPLFSSTAYFTPLALWSLGLGVSLETIRAIAERKYPKFFFVDVEDE